MKTKTRSDKKLNETKLWNRYQAAKKKDPTSPKTEALRKEWRFALNWNNNIDQEAYEL